MISYRGVCRSHQSDSRTKVTDTSVFTHTILIDLAVAWSVQLLFDIFIFLLTLMRSLYIRKEGSRGIIEILLRDGVSFELGLPLKLMLMDC